MNIIRRFEVKIPIPLNRLERVLSWLKVHPLMFKEVDPQRYVNSLYLDNANMERYEENLSGISRRKKVRIRWYHELNETQEATLEFKHREAGKGFKVRFPLHFDITQPHSNWFKHLSACHKQMPANARQTWGSERFPVLICRYKRAYYASACAKIRATFDHNIQIYDQRYRARPNLSKSHPLGDYVLLELKADEQFEQELSALISTCPLRPSRHSKYVNGIRVLTWI